jgi:hypothetical protein
MGISTIRLPAGTGKNSLMIPGSPETLIRKKNNPHYIV